MPGEFVPLFMQFAPHSKKLTADRIKPSPAFSSLYNPSYFSHWANVFLFEFPPYSLPAYGWCACLAQWFTRGFELVTVGSNLFMDKLGDASMELDALRLGHGEYESFMAPLRPIPAERARDIELMHTNKHNRVREQYLKLIIMRIAISALDRSN